MNPEEIAMWTQVNGRLGGVEKALRNVVYLLGFIAGEIGLLDLTGRFV